MKHFLSFVIAGLLLTSGAAEAAQKLRTFTNAYSTNHIMLWTDDPATTDITSIDFLSGMDAWTGTIGAGGDTLDLQAPTLTPIAPSSGEYRVRFQYSRTLSVQWAELYFDGVYNNYVAGGTLFWSGGWAQSTTFTHLADIPNLAPAVQAVPLPRSVVLMLSAIAFVGFTRPGSRRR